MLAFLRGYLLNAHYRGGVALRLLLLLLLGPVAAVQAQAPAWATALGSVQQSGSGAAVSRATAVNAAGDVLVAGSFSGQVGFGATTLSSAGGYDVFVAKRLSE